MGRNTSRITVSSTDGAVNAILGGIPRSGTRAGPVAFRYNQGEDQFMILDGILDVPALPVHHSMDNPAPPAGYVEAIANIASRVAKLCPWLLADTRWFFDPYSINTPSFYRVVPHEGQRYLYLVMIDLLCRPLECEITDPGTNARTHAYRSNRLYFECDYLPLSDATTESELALNQTIPVTWKGESGEGYMVHGIWMDADINKFFSKLALPEGKRNHPYYPITCKQRCVSMNALGQSGPSLLHRARAFIEPSLDRILEDLQSAPFSELMPLFREMKTAVPADIPRRWENLHVRAELNEREQKEYLVEL